MFYQPTLESGVECQREIFISASIKNFFCGTEDPISADAARTVKYLVIF